VQDISAFLSHVLDIDVLGVLTSEQTLHQQFSMGQ
jgi:hypothetical protein